MPTVTSESTVLPQGRRLRVLYVGSLGAKDTSTHRRWAIERLGNEVIEFDAGPYYSSGNGLSQRIRVRTLAGWSVYKLNRGLVDLACRKRPDVIWFDKAIFVRARTIRKLREEGFFTVHFNPDNPFGPRNDPGWRLFRRALPEYDLHLVPRKSNLDQYRNAGARDIVLKYFDYDPEVHFPPPQGWSDADRSYDVVFLGHPYDKRAEFFLELWERYGIRTLIWGNERWKSALPERAWSALYRGEGVWNAAYREKIWRSRICLSFVTHSNCDDVAYRSFEITGCGAFMLVEDTPEHRAHFTDNQEAVFFRTVDDCAAMIRRYLPDETARTQIARAGHERAVSSGYSTDARIGGVLDYIRSRLSDRTSNATE
jgi:spore maturation protein CgeB